jgi:two-component system response regulator AtoC
MVKRGEFREDLYYRLNVIHVGLPPLRERPGEVTRLAHYFLERFSSQNGGKVHRFSQVGLEAMEQHSWPGNVRELENVVQRAVVLADGPTIETWHLPENLRNDFEQPKTGELYEEEVRNFKRRLIVRKLQECGGNKAETARVLGLARGYLHRLINELRIRPEEIYPEALSLHEKPVPKGIM